MLDAPKRFGRFLLHVLAGFRANQGFLLAGAVSFYTLLSMVPLVALLLLTLSKFFEQDVLLAVIADNLSILIPELSESILTQIRDLISRRGLVSWIGVGVWLFFSTLAFTTLENAMSVIFLHRVAIRRRHFLVSAIIPFLFMLILGIVLVGVTMTSSVLAAFEGQRIAVLDWSWRPGQYTGALLHLIGFGGLVLLLTSIYLVMPVGRIPFRHALIGGIVGGVLWEITRRALIWYFSTLSYVNFLYGSFAATIVTLLSMEAGAVIILLGGQFIAEYERRDPNGRFATFGDDGDGPRPIETDPPT